MRRCWPLLSVFSVAYAFFIIAPSVFHSEFPLRSGMEWGDVLDVATPYIVLGLAWLIIQRSVSTVDSRLALAFLLLALVWAQGQGMHLAANSIGHEVPEAEQSRLADLIHFYDERLSHYIWYLAVALLPAYLLVLMWRGETLASAGSPWPALPPALVFGAVLGVSSIEAAVVPMVLPAFALTAILAALLYRRIERLRGVELFVFSGASVLVAVGVLLGWGAYHGGWPEPSELGLI